MSACQDDVELIANTYEDEFYRYLMLAKSFVEKLKERQDRVIGVKWIRMMCQLQSPDPLVKSNRNVFFQYFLQVLQTAVIKEVYNSSPNPFTYFRHTIHDLATVEDPAWLNRELQVPEYTTHNIEESSPPYIAHWSRDKKTYVAAKALPGQGALIYMAVSKDPSNGWDNLTEC